MKLFKNIKVKLFYQPVEAAVEKMADVLFEDEEIIAYYESSKVRLAFTSKRIILLKVKEDVTKSCAVYSYRNIAAYGVKKNKLTLSLVNSPEYSGLTLTVVQPKGEKDENGVAAEPEYVAEEKLRDLCRYMGNLIW